MKLLSLISVGLMLTLIACAPTNSAKDVSAVGPNQITTLQTQISGLSNSLAPAPIFEDFGSAEGDRSFHADIAFYETVLSYGPVTDARPVFLLANAYIVSNQQKIGIAYFERLLTRYENQMTNEVRSTYLAAYSLVRATYAEDVPIPGRIFWVQDTFKILEEAKIISNDTNPLVKWASGIIYTQVPGFFGKRDEALAELLWLADHPETEPTPGFYREVYRHLSLLYTASGDDDLAAQYLAKSGYQDYAPATLFMGWFASTKDKGLLFAPTPWIEDIVPDKVFAVRGFGFSDLYFVVSEDGKELISIDAGTQPYSMRAGYEFLLSNHSNIPPLTTAFITHAHWDHIGGYTYLKTLNPEIVVYGRKNYQDTVVRVLRKHVYDQFRGAGFKDEWVKAYHPDIVVDTPTQISIGGTSFDLIPARGGETEDAMLINMSGAGIVFTGDALMPFYGEPWVEEGLIDDAVITMDQILDLKPKAILHGHFGITAIYGRPSELSSFRDDYVWLVQQTRHHISSGYSMEEIRRLNLIPPDLRNHTDAMLGYLAPRDHIIARVADQMTGIWRENITGQEPDGIDTITSVEYGRMLEVYLGLSAKQTEKALRRMLDGGDNELALQMAVAAETRFPNNTKITKAKIEAADRLRSAAQYFDPFAFVTYTEIAGKEHPSIPAQ